MLFHTINKFFKPYNYVIRVKKLHKKIKIIYLRKTKFADHDFNFTWRIDTNQKFEFDYLEENKYSIFGIWQDLGLDINWHQDKFSNFLYPLKRFDKINATQYFDKGIELVFPWEQSRFYFGINLARKYLVSKDRKYYILFRSLVEDWLEKNPFLYGVNWFSTMDVSIRAINWIVALNLFSELFSSDTVFQKKISKSLSQHAEYISQFPLIERGGLTTNHTTSAYAGLLFLSLTLKDHPKSGRWINVAKKGLENCMDGQVYSDGVDFEGSIPYHRLVLEFFAYSTILAHSNNLKFSLVFYKKLFKMFEFTAAYIDKNGNAPQIGDNDSGRLLIFNETNNNPYLSESDHGYLLVLGEKIFKYNFHTRWNKDSSSLDLFLPEIKAINPIKSVDHKFNTAKSVSFPMGGFYFFKNNYFDLCVSCIPAGQNGKGGHNHLDCGSFTLSVDGKQIVVDPGSYCYSRNRGDRDKFRSYIYHNTIYSVKDQKLDLGENGYWSLKNYYSAKHINFSKNSLELKLKFVKDKNERFRKFKLSQKKIFFSHEYNGKFYTRINLHPNVDCKTDGSKEVVLDKYIKLLINSRLSNITLEDYYFSPYYGVKEKSKFLLIESMDFLEFKILKV